MNVFSQTQRYKALFWLSLFHLLVITSSNYLVQLPVSIFGFHTTWGAFSFPFIFLATDLTVRIFGAPLARRIIFAVNFAFTYPYYAFDFFVEESILSAVIMLIVAVCTSALNIRIRDQGTLIPVSILPV